MPAKPTTPLGANIKAARERRGYTQLNLAHAIGHEGDEAGAYICRVENGETIPRLDTLQKIADALKVDMRDLFGTRPAQTKA